MDRALFSFLSEQHALLCEQHQIVLSVHVDLSSLSTDIRPDLSVTERHLLAEQ